MDNHSFTISSLSTYEIEIKYFADILLFWGFLSNYIVTQMQECRRREREKFLYKVFIGGDSSSCEQIQLLDGWSMFVLGKARNEMTPPALFTTTYRIMSRNVNEVITMNDGKYLKTILNEQWEGFKQNKTKELMSLFWK